MRIKQETFQRLCRARDVLGAIDVEVERAPSIEEIARLAGISPFHFIRQFEAVFGTTPHQFRIRSRVERAKVLLAGGERSVTDVCLDVGFESLGSFSDLFKRRVGAAPSAYRRRARTLVQVPGAIVRELFPGCLTLMGRLPAGAFGPLR